MKKSAKVREQEVGMDGKRKDQRTKRGDMLSRGITEINISFECL